MSDLGERSHARFHAWLMDEKTADGRRAAVMVAAASLVCVALLPSSSGRLGAAITGAVLAVSFEWGASAAVALLIALRVGEGGARLIPSVLGHEVTSWLLLAFAAAILLGRRFAPYNEVRERKTGTERAVALILGAGVLTAVARRLLGGDAALGGLLAFVVSAAVFVVVAGLAPCERSFRRAVLGLLSGMGFQVVVGVLEVFRGSTYFFSKMMPFRAPQYWGPFVRVASTASDPNYFALGLVAALPLLLAYVSTLAGWRRVSYIGVAVWVAVACLTFSRAGLVALGVYGVMLLLGAEKKRAGILLVAGLIAGIVVVLAVPSAVSALVGRLASFKNWGSDASLQLRIQGQIAALRAFLAHPVLGIGYDRFIGVSTQYLTDTRYMVTAGVFALNSFLTVAAEGGAPALAGFVGAFAASVSACCRANSADRYARPLAHGIILFGLMSLTLDGFRTPMQWVVFGLAALLARRTTTAASASATDAAEAAMERGSILPALVSVLVVSYETREATCECVSRALASTAELEVIVVDNGSSDGSAEAIAERFPQVLLVANEENRGFGAACNQAWSRAGGRYVLLLNNDCYVEPDTIATCVRELETLGATAVACQLRDPDCAIQPSVRRLPSPISELARAFVPPSVLSRTPVLGRYFMAGWDHRGTRRVEQPAGAFLLMRQGAWGDGAPFDERFFMFYEDVDLCARMLQASGRIWFTDRVFALHEREHATSRVRAAMARALVRSRYRYFEKWYGRSAAISVTVLNVLGNLARAMTWKAMSLVSEGDPELTAANVAAARAGLDVLRRAA